MIQLYTDGGSRGNPGPAAYGFLIFEGGENIYDEGKKIGNTTNNVAEYTAIIEGLKKCRGLSDTVEVFSDSELVIKQLNGQYKVKQPHLQELHYKVQKAEKDFKKVTYAHRRREEPMQKLADALVNKALDEKK
jgi:ribonuclease HI